MHTHTQVHACISLYTGTHTYVFLYMWKPEDSLKCCSSGIFHLDFLWQDVLLSGLDQLSSKPQASSCPCFPSAEITNTTTSSWIKPPSSCLYDKYFTYWDNSSALSLFPLCVCICICIHMHTVACAHMWEGQRSVLSDIPLLVSTLCFETGSLTEMGAHPCNCTKWSAMLRAVSPPPQHWSCRSTALPAFYMTLNSSPCLLTWLSS